jgi:hypothetical protein
MQPARQDVVWNLTVPASAATASARRGAMMSLPSWPPLPRASPKSSVYVDVPTTGKISRGTPFLIGACFGAATGVFGSASLGGATGFVFHGSGSPGEAAALGTARPRRRRKRIPRAVVRWLIKAGLRFALEGPYGNGESGVRQTIGTACAPL